MDSLNRSIVPEEAPSRVFTMSAFCPPTRLPPPPPPPPQTYNEYSTQLTLIPHYVYPNLTAFISPGGDGTIKTWAKPATGFSISNVLKDIKWDENTLLKPGGGIIGVGASKVTIFVSIVPPPLCIAPGNVT